MKRLICLLFGLSTLLVSAAVTQHPRRWLTGADLPRLRRWAFYLPSMAAPALSDYAASRAYDVLRTANAGEGFWVNARTAFTAQLPVGAAVLSASFQNMTSGWHLIATGSSQTPSGFNTDMRPTPPATAVVPQNMTTLWMWGSAQSKWYFYAPGPGLGFG